MQDNELKNGQTVPPQDEAAQQAPADAPELPDLDLSAELAKAQAKAAESYDLYVRAVAEADNTRRRASEDVAKARKFGIEKFAESMLPVVDSMEKALEASANEKGPLKEGLEITYRQLLSAGDNHGERSCSPAGLRRNSVSARMENCRSSSSSGDGGSRSIRLVFSGNDSI